MMRTREKQHPELYPNWRKKKESPAKQAKKRDGNHCIFCGAEDRQLTTNRDGELCIRYLYAGHLHILDPLYWQTEPIEGQRLRAMCPTCHGTYDQYWKRRAEEVEHQRRLHQILISQWLMQRFLEVQ
jgi:hypothetical protein